MRNAYEVLGIDTNASLLEIRRVYRQKVRDCHPDLAGDSAVDIFLAVQKAYEILSNPKRRYHLGEIQMFASEKPAARRFSPETQTMIDNFYRIKEERYS